MVTPERYRSDVDCINAYSPTLKDMQEVYGAMAKLWIQEQINMFQTITGVRNKLLAHQVVMLIETFLTNENVKASMLLNFFHKLIAGHYGRFYGSIDIMQIGEAWQAYIANCNEIYKAQVKRFKDEERANRDAEKERQIEAERKNAISWDEFYKIQKERYNIDVPSLNVLSKQILKSI